jgi:outer membrane lipoprotein-sorting protein
MSANVLIKEKPFICCVIAFLLTNAALVKADEELNSNNSDNPDKPKIVSIYPPSDSKMALLSELKITFDQPMIPDEFNVVDASIDKDREIWSKVNIIRPFCSYDSNNNTFTLLLALPGNWNGQIRLYKFKNIEGVEANDVVVDYHTLRDSFSKDLLARFEKERQSSELRELLKKIKEARDGIFSLSEKINITSDFGVEKKEESIAVKMNKGGRFVVDMSGMFNHKWNIGCDGNQCWQFYTAGDKGDHLEKEDLKDINEMHISICDLFGLNKKDINEVFSSNNLEYGGTSLCDGQDCFIIRSWKAFASPAYTSCDIDEWQIDGKNYMPVRMTSYYMKSKMTNKYSYDSINMPIPDSEFRPDSLTNAPGVSEPLGDGYDTRFIRVIDGTSYGNMSFSWGKRGPKGTSSGGLN